MLDKNVETIDDYIAASPIAKVRTRLKQMRATIRKHAPEATEKISYRMPTFYLNGNLVYFAAFQHHVGFYPGAAAIVKFEKALKAFKTSKGTVQFPHDAPLPLELVAEIVDYRVEASIYKKPRPSKR